MTEDPHDSLVQAYLSYFKANENFEARNSHRTHAESRKWLREIRKYAKQKIQCGKCDFNSCRM